MTAELIDTGLVWLRRDLRTRDHTALHHALASCRRVYCVFVFDRDILDALPERTDRRVAFIREALLDVHAWLQGHGSGLIVAHDTAPAAIDSMVRRLGAQAVFAARDYEPQAVQRDQNVAQRLAAQGCTLRLFKDQVIFETDEVMTATGRPYSVFTPYRNAWMKRLHTLGDQAAPGTPLASNDISDSAAAALVKVPADLPHAQTSGALQRGPVHGVPALADLGFHATDLAELGIVANEAGAQALLADFSDRIGRYREARDFPAVRGPSYLSVHLRFGTISIRTLAREALRSMLSRPDTQDGAHTWLSELIWREFYFQVLHHHPHSAQHSFRPEYDAIRWETGTIAQQHFDAWCNARTGYPLVDAAMAQIRSSGYMHNRLRMVVASFLCKDLGLDWRLGERWFAQRLIDYDLSANAGGWQWAASSGCDAQPWFRIFNPITQSEKFDPAGRFIRRYVPALARMPDRWIHAPWLAPRSEQERAGCIVGQDYPLPIVDHAQARERTLARYAVVKSKAVLKPTEQGES
jgi:deoxyribodipyrimidine photo-lyase